MMIRSENEHNIRKQVYNCLTIKKGSFYYDENLGSNLASVNLKSKDAKKNCELAVKEALLSLPFVKYLSCELSSQNESEYGIKVLYEYLGKSHEMEVRIYG